MAILTHAAKNIIDGIEDVEVRFAAHGLVQDAEDMVRAEMMRRGYTEYPEGTLRRILGALAAQWGG